MAYIKENWNGKNERAKVAQYHTSRMNALYSYEIKISSDQTKIYDTDFHNNDEIYKETEIILDSIDSVTSIFKYNWHNTAVLNFASYKAPGGMFIEGSKAQEECLCHSSFLYNVLSQKTDYYNWNNAHKNRSLYMNRALYSPEIMFFNRDDLDDLGCSVSVITCAAPNKSAAQKYCNVQELENFKCLYDRIRFVLDIAKDNKVDTLILGAYGCGVFGQNPEEVATAFKHLLTTTHKSFEKVIFAVPKGNGNYEKFKGIFG